MINVKELGFLFWIFAIAHGSEIVEFENFIEGIIDSWQLRSPTLIVQGDMPQLCVRLEWALCLLKEDSEMDELAEHMATIHKLRKQDGVILIGRQGHEQLLKQINTTFPSMLTSNYPTFMPTSYRNDIKLRLDSNVIFYEEKSSAKYKYEVYDIFAVKDGPPITEKLGHWDMENGISLLASMNRWDRRTDLKGAPFINSVVEYRPNVAFIRDEYGNITGTEGIYQEQLFYITDKLNLTIEIVKVAFDFNRDFRQNAGGCLEVRIMPIL